MSQLTTLRHVIMVPLHGSPPPGGVTVPRAHLTKWDTQRKCECAAALSYKNRQLERERQRTGSRVATKMLLPLSLASAVQWRFLSKVKKDLTQDKKWDKLCSVMLSGLLYKWTSKPACYWSSRWTSRLKGNEQLDVILCSLPPFSKRSE